MNKFICFLFFLFFAQLNATEINFGISQNPQNLDPRYARDAISERIVDLVYEKIVYVDDNFGIKSNFFDILNKNDQVYNLIYKGSKSYFHDGQPLNIDDILFTIDLNRNDRLSRFYEDLKVIESVNLQGSNIKITLKNPDKNFLFKLAIPILSSKHKGDSEVKIIGSNVFKYEFNNNKNTLIRNDGVKIILHEVKNPNMRVLKITNSELDLVQNDIPLPLVGYLKSQKNVKTYSNFGNNVSYIGFNFNDTKISNIHLRKAIKKAIDKTIIIKNFFNENTLPANQIFSNDHWCVENLPFNDFDLEEARNEILNSGLSLPVELEFKTSADPFRIKIATILQNQLKKIGVHIKIKSLDWGTFFRDIQAGNFQMYSLTWVGLNNPEVYERMFSANYFPPFGLNRGRYSSDKMNLLLKDALKTNNWGAVIKEVDQEIAFLPLWFEGNFAATSWQISNFNLSSNGSWNFLKTIQKNDQN